MATFYWPGVQSLVAPDGVVITAPVAELSPNWSTALLQMPLDTAPEKELREMLERIRCELYDRERRPKM